MGTVNRLARLLGCLLLATGLGAQGLEPAATLSYVLGDVEVQRGGGGAWAPARIQQGLFPGDRIRTGSDGSAELVFGGSSRLRLAERTDLLVPDQAENRGGLLQRVRVMLGSIWSNIRRLGDQESFEVEGAHSIGGVKGTRFSLTRGAGDLWRLAQGRIGIRRKGQRQGFDLAPGQQVEIDADKQGAIGAADPETMQRSWLDFNSRGARRWEGIVTRLLAAARRLLQQAERADPVSLERIRSQMDEVGSQLREARQQIDRFLEGRNQDEDDRRFGSGDLAGFADRAIEQYERMAGELGRAGDRGAGGVSGPGGSSTPAADASALATIRAADAFLSRFHEGLRRAQRAFHRHLKRIEPLKPFQVAAILEKVLGGYRQSEARYQEARRAVRASGSQPSPEVERAFRELDRKWRTIGRDFRILRQLADKVKGTFGGRGGQIGQDGDATDDLPRRLDGFGDGAPTGGGGRGN